MRLLGSWLVWHATVVAALIMGVVAVVVLSPRGGGVNFLLVVPLFPLLGLGLPWSAAPIFLDSNYAVAGTATLVALNSAPALLNLALHALVRGWLWNRTRRAGPDAR